MYSYSIPLPRPSSGCAGSVSQLPVCRCSTQSHPLPSKSSGWELVGSRPQKTPSERRPAQVGGLWVAQTHPCRERVWHWEHVAMGGCDQLWPHLSVGPCPARLQEQQRWETAGLLLSSVPCLKGLGGLEDSVPAGSEELVGCSSRQEIKQTGNIVCCVLRCCIAPALHARLPCPAARCPAQRRPCVPGARSLPARGLTCGGSASAAAHNIERCQDHRLDCLFSFWWFCDLNSSAFPRSSRAGHTNTGISMVGGVNKGQTHGAGLTTLVL